MKIWSKWNPFNVLCGYIIIAILIGLLVFIINLTNRRAFKHGTQEVKNSRWIVKGNGLLKKGSGEEMSQVRVKVFEGVTDSNQLQWYMNDFLKAKNISYVGHSVSLSKDLDIQQDVYWYAGSIAYKER